MKRKTVAFILFLLLMAGFLGGIAGSSIAERDIKIIKNFQDNTVTSEESAYIKVSEEVSPAVVSIIKNTTKSGPQINSGRLPQIIGTGFIISSDGTIVTNAHVVDNASDSYSIITKDKQTFPVIKINRNIQNDIAVLSVAGFNLPAVKMGDSDYLKPGQRIIVIGSVLGKLDNSVTVGIISALGREITAYDPNGTTQETLKDMIQIDAALNPGNSGGPLLNLYGEVIGVNSALTEGAENIGFAIPINNVKKILNNIPITS